MMHEGLLWFDDDPTHDLPAKVRKGADYYRRKIGRDPTFVVVNLTTPGAGVLTVVDGIEIDVARNVLLNHLWFGRHADDESEAT